MKHNYNIFRAVLVTLLFLTYVPFLKAEGGDNDSWEVEIIKNATNEIVKSGVVHTNSFSLEGLECNVGYFARIRTKNTFLSEWEVSDVFMLDSGLKLISPSVFETELRLSSDNGLLYISSGTLQKISIYTIEGCLLRSILLPKGNTTVAGLTKGLYIVNGQKILVK